RFLVPRQDDAGRPSVIGASPTQRDRLDIEAPELLFLAPDAEDDAQDEYDRCHEGQHHLRRHRSHLPTSSCVIRLCRRTPDAVDQGIHLFSEETTLRWYSGTRLPVMARAVRDITTADSGNSGRANRRPRLVVCRRTSQAAQKVQMRGGAQWPDAWRTLRTLSVRLSARTTQMVFF